MTAIEGPRTAALKLIDADNEYGDFDYTTFMSRLLIVVL